MRNTLRYLPAQIGGPAGQFLAILVFTHWMAPEPYGVLTYVFASQEFVFFLCLAWWSQYTVRYYGEHAEAPDQLYERSEGAIMAATALAQVAATLFALTLISTPTTPALAAAAVVYMVTRCLNVHLGERARAQSLFFDYSVAALAGPMVGFAVAFAIVARVSDSPAAALFAYGAVQAVSLVWLAVRQRISVHWRAPDAALVRRALAFGLPLILAGLAAWASTNSIRVVVDREMGAATMGLVSVGWSLGQRLTSTLVMLMTVAAFPLAVERLREGSRAEAMGEIARNGTLMAGLVLPAAVGLYLIERPVIDLLVAAPFREMTAAVLPAALVAGLARYLRTHVADQIFLLIARTPMVTVIAVVETALVVAGCVTGLLTGGAVGAAVGSAVGYMATMVVGFALAWGVAGLRLPVKDLCRVFVATAAMAIVVESVAVQRLPGGPLLGVLVAVVCGVVTYLLALALLFPGLVRWLQLRVQPPRSWKKS